ncbi:MAG: hypothetical protein JSS67_11125 [Bacteroidetes bacterium]|nr:hypothetical protein [Bacteroidota bacterium]
MENLTEKEKSEPTFKKNIIRFFAYLFCAFLIWFGFDTLTKTPTTTKDILKGIGIIAAACIYLFVDFRILISKNKRPNR